MLRKASLVLPKVAVFRYHGLPVALTKESIPSSRRRALRDILLYGVCGGVLIAVLKLTAYRFLVVEHSVEIYVALVAALFAALGIWLGPDAYQKKAGDRHQGNPGAGRRPVCPL